MQALFETRLTGGVRRGEGNVGGFWFERLNLRRERWPGTPVFGQRGRGDYQFTKLNDAGAPKLVRHQKRIEPTAANSQKPSASRTIDA